MWQRELAPTRACTVLPIPDPRRGNGGLGQRPDGPQALRLVPPKGTNMDPGKSFLIALDRKTGETRWKVDRRSELAGYATPCIRRSGGRTEVVFSSTAHGITAVDLKSGRISWEIDKIWDNRTVSSPQLFGDLVWQFRKGFVRPTPGRGPSRETGSRKGELVYDITKSVPLVPSFVVKDGLLYLWTDSGIVTCVDAATGKEHWRKRVRWRILQLPRLDRKPLYCISKYGQIVVLAASKNFEVLARMELDEERMPPRPSPTASCICVRKRVCTRLEKCGSRASRWADGNRGSILSRANLSGRSIFNGKKGLIGVIFAFSQSFKRHTNSC